MEEPVSSSLEATTTTETLALLDLPSELILYILAFLDPYDLLSCRLSCKFFNEVILSSSQIQYVSALTLSKSEDNPCSVAPLSQKLADLRSAEEAWCTLQPKFITNIPIRHETSGIYDLSGGTYLLGNWDRLTLQYIILPRRREDVIEWNKVAVNARIIDMGFCVFEHDLISIITTSSTGSSHAGLPEFAIEMHLLEYSTSKPHPQAKQSRILVMESTFERPAIMCEIVGENLVLLLTCVGPDTRHYNDRVFIYDWRNNVLKASFQAQNKTYHGFIMLSETLVLFPNHKTNAFDIFSIPPVATPHVLTPMLTLCLPALADGNTVALITCRAEPNPLGRDSKLDKRTKARAEAEAEARAGSSNDPDSQGSSDSFKPKRSFLASSNEAICIFQLKLRSEPLVIPQIGINVHFDVGRTFTFFVRRKSFLEVVERWEAGEFESTMPVPTDANDIQSDTDVPMDGTAIPPAPPNVPFLGGLPGFPIPIPAPPTTPPATSTHPSVPWASWGPPVSRWFNADAFPSRWITTSAGQRCVVIHEDARREGSSMMVIDFNDNVLRRMRKRVERAKEAQMAEQERKKKKRAERKKKWQAEAEAVHREFVKQELERQEREKAEAASAAVEEDASMDVDDDAVKVDKGKAKAPSPPPDPSTDPTDALAQLRRRLSNELDSPTPDDARMVAVEAARRRIKELREARAKTLAPDKHDSVSRLGKRPAPDTQDSDQDEGVPKGNDAPDDGDDDDDGPAGGAGTSSPAAGPSTSKRSRTGPGIHEVGVDDHTPLHLTESGMENEPLVAELLGYRQPVAPPPPMLNFNGAWVGLGGALAAVGAAGVGVNGLGPFGNFGLNPQNPPPPQGQVNQNQNQNQNQNAGQNPGAGGAGAGVPPPQPFQNININLGGFGPVPPQNVNFNVHFAPPGGVFGPHMFFGGGQANVNQNAAGNAPPMNINLPPPPLPPPGGGNPNANANANGQWQFAGAYVFNGQTGTWHPPPTGPVAGNTAPANAPTASTSTSTNPTAGSSQVEEDDGDDDWVTDDGSDHGLEVFMGMGGDDDDTMPTLESVSSDGMDEFIEDDEDEDDEDEDDEDGNDVFHDAMSAASSADSLPNLESVSDSDEEYEDLDDTDEERVDIDLTGPPRDPRHPGRARIQWVDTPGRIDAVRSFAEPVEGRLPYVLFISETHYGYDGVLADEERIIGIRTDASERIRSVDVFYFG